MWSLIKCGDFLDLASGSVELSAVCLQLIFHIMAMACYCFPI